MHGQEGRNLAAQLLWKSLDNPEKVRLNDNLLLNEEYKKLFNSGEFWYHPSIYENRLKLSHLPSISLFPFVWGYFNYGRLLKTIQYF